MTKKLQGSLPKSTDFSTLIEILCSRSLLNKCLGCCKCSSIVELAISKSSIYAYTSGKPLITWSINLLKVCAALVISKDIRRNSNDPKGVATIVFGMFSGATGIW